MTPAGPDRFTRAVRVFEADDPVAAVLQANVAGRPIALGTSGSSGAPRAVVRTPESWFSSFPAVSELLGLDGSSRVWVPGPLTSTMNLFAAVHAATVGARLVASLEEATHAHLTPVGLLRLLGDDGPHHRLDGPRERLDGLHVLVAGDRLSPALHRRAVEAGARASHYYGAAELSFVAWGRHGEDLRPFPGVEVDGRDGVLWVRSPYLCAGYLGPPGPLVHGADGWATVGDRGTVSGGVVTVHGRGDEAVTTAGATVWVADVEQALRGAARGEVVVLGIPHPRLGQVLAAVLTDAADLGAVRRAARAGLVPSHRPRLWFHVRRLPTTAAGKADRAALRRAVEESHAARLV